MSLSYVPPTYAPPPYCTHTYRSCTALAHLHVHHRRAPRQAQDPPREALICFCCLTGKDRVHAPSLIVDHVFYQDQVNVAVNAVLEAHDLGAGVGAGAGAEAGGE